jgi:glyoxylase-like metal-dependent hydrolase (beta-lactamase superfamily II)
MPAHGNVVPIGFLSSRLVLPTLGAPILPRTGSRASVTAAPDAPREIASGVFCHRIPGRTRTNVYFVRSGSGWALVDAGWRGDGAGIAAVAEALCGRDGPPAAILLSHAHPDHAGSARELARAWGAPVFVHPAELAVARGDFEAMTAYAGPLDRRLILPMMRLVGRRRREAMLARSSLGEGVRSLDLEGTIASLPDWRWVPSPGHTPGHVSFWRPTDRVLLSGDALVTVRVNALSGILFGAAGISGPPRYTTWSWPRAVHSIVRLADLEPTVLGAGHGLPLLSSGTSTIVAGFARGLLPTAPGGAATHL